MPNCDQQITKLAASKTPQSVTRAVHNIHEHGHMCTDKAGRHWTFHMTEILYHFTSVITMITL